MKSRIRLTDAQFAVLEALWNNGLQTIRQLTAILYPSQTTSDYATVQKLLEQLEDKGCVQRNRSEFAHTFVAKVERSDLIDSQLKEMADRLCGGSLTSVLMHLVENATLSRTEREALQKLLLDSKTKFNSTRKHNQ